MKNILTQRLARAFGVLLLACLFAVISISANAQSPAGITTAPILWLKADAITGVANGGAVASWPDSSANGYTFTQATVGSQPTLSNNALGGKPVVIFNGSRIVAPTAFATTAQSYTMFCVVADTANGWIYRSTLPGGVILLKGGQYPMSSTGPGGYHVQEYVMNGGATPASYFIRDGLPEGSTSYGNTPMGPNGGFNPALGGDNTSNSSGINGGIAEFIIEPGVLSTTDRTSIRNYLLAKYAIGSPVVVSPASVSGSSTGNTVTITGATTGFFTTAWTASTAFVLDSASVTRGAVITAQSINTTTQVATITLSAGSPGAITYTNNTDGSLVYQSVGTASQVFPVNDTHLYFSPYNWYVNGSTYAQTTCSGAYVKFGFTGSSLTLQIDTSPLGGGSIGTGNFPIIRYTIDGVPTTDVQLPGTGNTVSLATGLAAGSHTAQVWVRATYQYGDRWGTSGVSPADVMRLTGIQIDSPGTLAFPTILPKRILYFGDSITEGVRAISLDASLIGTDGTQTAAQLLAVALNAEVGIVGYGGQAWASAGAGSVPAFTSSWNFQQSGVSRSFSPVPDYLVENEGTNGSIVNTVVAGWLSAVRPVVGATTKIILLDPFASGNNLAALQSGLANYITASGADANAFAISATSLSSPYIYQGIYSLDSKHPLNLGHSLIGSILASVITKSIGGSSGLTTTGGQIKRGR